MDHFTLFDWAIIGAILVAGLVAATAKVFLFDDQHDKSKR